MATAALPLLGAEAGTLLGSFFGGPSPAEKQAQALTANIGKWATTAGESDISKSQNFWSAILSGDATKIATVLGPEMSAFNRQGNSGSRLPRSLARARAGRRARCRRLMTALSRVFGA